MDQTTKPELEQYLRAELLIPKSLILLKETKEIFLNTWTGLKENITNKHIEKSTNTKMGHLHMRIQGLKSTRDIPQDKDMKYKSKTNLVFYTTVDPSTMKEGKFTHIYEDSSSSH